MEVRNLSSGAITPEDVQSGWTKGYSGQYIEGRSAYIS